MVSFSPHNRKHITSVFPWSELLCIDGDSEACLVWLSSIVIFFQSNALQFAPCYCYDLLCCIMHFSSLLMHMCEAVSLHCNVEFWCQNSPSFVCQDRWCSATSGWHGCQSKVSRSSCSSDCCQHLQTTAAGQWWIVRPQHVKAQIPLYWLPHDVHDKCMMFPLAQIPIPISQKFPRTGKFRGSRCNGI